MEGRSNQGEDMTEEYKQAYKAALENAATMIKEHLNGGMVVEEIGFDPTVYEKACDRAYKTIMRLADKIQTNNTQDNENRY